MHDDGNRLRIHLSHRGIVNEGPFDRQRLEYDGASPGRYHLKECVLLRSIAMAVLGRALDPGIQEGFRRLVIPEEQRAAQDLQFVHWRPLEATAADIALQVIEIWPAHKVPVRINPQDAIHLIERLKRIANERRLIANPLMPVFESLDGLNGSILRLDAPAVAGLS